MDPPIVDPPIVDPPTVDPPIVDPPIVDPPRKGHCIIPLYRGQFMGPGFPIVAIQFEPPRRLRTTALQETKHVNLYCPQHVLCSEVSLYMVYVINFVISSQLSPVTL